MLDLKGKKVLVTGASGLIGSNLVKRLKEIPDINILCTTYQNKVDADVSLARGDLLDQSHCDSITKDIDVVFHCAAKSYGAAVMESDPMALVKDNIVMNINILEASHKNNVKKFIWLASTTGYPDTDQPVTEDMMFDGDPFDKYYAVGWVKRYTEVLCKLFSEKLDKKLTCIILRPTNIYGPGDKTDPKKSHVLAASMRKIVEKHNPIEVWGDGLDQRDVLYVDDMVDAMILAAERIDKFEQFNIGYGETFSILDLLGKMKEIGNHDAPYKMIPSGPRMIPIRQVNIDKAKTVLGWEPKITLDDGLKKMHMWMKSTLNK